MTFLKEAQTRERIKALKAMEFLARQINDENIFDFWLREGVADEDIEYGDLEVREGDAEAFEDYIQDKAFRGLMKTFLWCMRDSFSSGGLYCGGVVSE